MDIVTDEVCENDAQFNLSSPLELESQPKNHHLSLPSLSASTASRHFLGVAPLAMIVFYNVSGGPFGIEEAVRSAGFFVSLLGFIVMPFVWSVPEALITAELGSAFPEASGGVAWVEEAFGSAIGWQAGYLGWIAGACDNAIYPVLFLDYMIQLGFSQNGMKIHPFLQFCIISVMSILLGILNWRGIHIVGGTSIFIGVLSLLPFVIMIVIGSFSVDTNRWFEGMSIDSSDPDIASSPWKMLTSNSIQWRPLLNCLFWNMNSYDSAASYSAEIQDPGYVLPRSLLWGVLLTTMGYVLPLAVAIGATDSIPEDWTDGYLTTAAAKIGGEWLAVWVVFAAGISNVALFQAELSADAFQLMGMAERGLLPKIFATRSQHGTPTYGIILGVAVIISMGSFDLEYLIEILNFNYALSLVLEYAAFIKLRISRPDVLRPYRIPLGTAILSVYFVLPVGGIFIIGALASSSTYLFSTAINIVGVIAFLVNKKMSENQSTESYTRVSMGNISTEGTEVG